jgi:GntR family transcriptional repressor for pyruvate dehydrogenase complex
MVEKAFLKKPVQSKTEQVIETLTELILTGDLENNSVLPPEKEMCSRLGVSRSIFREAMKILGAKGLVEIRQGFGTVVKAPSENVPAEALSNFIHLNHISLFQVMEIRAPLDVEIARLAARRRKKKHLEAMEQTLELMRARQRDQDAFAQADHDFHRILVTATENPLFIIITRSAERFVKYLRKVTVQFGTDKVIREHQAILDAVRSGKAAAAAAAMGAHMSATIKDLKRFYGKQKGDMNEAMRKSYRR